MAEMLVAPDRHRTSSTGAPSSSAIGRAGAPPRRTSSRTRASSAPPYAIHDRKKIERFSLAMMGFALQGPPGLGVFGGRPDVQEAYGYWPTLVPRELVRAARRDVARRGASVRELDAVAPSAARRGCGRAGGRGDRPDAGRVAATNAALRADRLHARSGDKGDHANIGVAARSPAAYAFLLTRRAHVCRRPRAFRDLVRGDVERFELPGLRAFNFFSATRSAAAARCRSGSTTREDARPGRRSASSSTCPPTCWRRHPKTRRADAC